MKPISQHAIFFVFSHIHNQHPCLNIGHVPGLMGGQEDVKRVVWYTSP